MKHPSGRSGTPKAQSKSFIDAARALECGESEERFDATLRKIAAHKPAKGKKHIRLARPKTKE